MAKKKKKRQQMPPLSTLDKLIYWVILLLLGIMYLVLLLGPLYLRDQIAFEDSMVIAKTDNASVFWLAVPWLTFFLTTFILWWNTYQDRRPIFGRRNFKYGPPAWPKIYPLFMKNKPYVWISEREKKNRQMTALVLTIILLISFIPFPWALYGRDCLYSDGSIAQYSMFNKQTEFISGPIDSAELETYRYSTGKYHKTTHWGVQLILTADSGREYVFKYSDFRNDVQTGTPYWLSAMLLLKRRYDPEIIAYNGTENLEKVIADRGLSYVESQMLYALFDGG